MPTFIHAITHWAQLLRAQHNQDVAILSRGINLIAYSVAGANATNGPDHRTAACNVLQSPAYSPQANLLALSYAPTAACIGMAAQLGIRRLVWVDSLTNIQHSMTLDRVVAPVHHAGGNQATVIQGHNVVYLAAQPLPAVVPPEVFPAAVRPHQFAVPAGTSDLVSSLVGPDDTVRDNMCMQLAFAVAFKAHGPLRPQPGGLPSRRRPAHYGQNIASVMVDNQYNILGWAINTNVANPSFHGEINMVRAHQRTVPGALPNNGKLFTTLEPCAMCSGMIVHATGPANTFNVISGQRDQQVGFSALRNGNGFDGQTANPRANTRHEIAKTPLAMGSNFDGHMNYAQRQAQPLPAQLMPTTRFLETQVGKNFMDDASRMLNMQAALWLPTAARPAWRQKLDAFLSFVEYVV